MTQILKYTDHYLKKKVKKVSGLMKDQQIKGRQM